VSLEFYVVVQLLIDREKRDGKMCTTYSARNNVVSHTLFYRPIYYNQKNERREYLDISKHAKTRSSAFVVSYIVFESFAEESLHREIIHKRVFPLY
jgi:hypothetical protein